MITIINLVTVTIRIYYNITDYIPYALHYKGKKKKEKKQPHSCPNSSCINQLNSINISIGCIYPLGPIRKEKSD